jgi:carbonic anhydrase
MASAPIPVRSEADIFPAYRGNPVGDLLRHHNLAVASRSYPHPEILVSTCMELPAGLRLPAGFAITLLTGAGGMKRMPFKVSWAVGVAGVTAIAVVGHQGCTMVGLRNEREQFVQRLVATGGWERAAAEQHFDHWGDLFEIADPLTFVIEESRRLRLRYPRLLVAPLMLDAGNGLLQQIPE